MGFIVGLNRNRDSYQVPIAFAERNELELFVTDYYHGQGPAGIPQLSHRQDPAIDPRLTRASWSALASQLPYEIKVKFGNARFPTVLTEGLLGKTIGKAASKRPESDLFLYSGSALPAFQGPSTGRRFLFQYNVTPKFMVEQTQGVDELAELRDWEEEAEVFDPKMDEVCQAEVALADHFVAASSVTKRSLLELGVAGENVSVAPYGCPEPERLEQPREVVDDFLFVGQGIKRKGLHLLLEAWRQAGIKGKTLRIVSSRIDPEILDFGRHIEGVTFSPRARHQEILEMMSRADTFVMPSLVESFGLVYGEALSRGCRIIATNTTGAADLGLSARTGTIIDPGQVDGLRAALQQHAETMQPDRPYWHESIGLARERSWAGFRELVYRSTAEGRGLR